jgi:hypothetical protein
MIEAWFVVVSDLQEHCEAKLRDRKQLQQGVLARTVVTHSIIEVCPVFVLTFFQSSGARPRWLRRQSEAVRQQNCDVANRCNRADRSWHRHRVSSGPRTTACDYLLRAERGGRERV